MAATKKTEPEINPVIAEYEKSGERAVRLWGYLGSSSDTEIVRVYRDLSAQTCWNIPKDQIVHSEHPEGSDTGFVRLFVRAQAEIEEVSSRRMRAGQGWLAFTADPLGEFLAGGDIGYEGPPRADSPFSIPGQRLDPQCVEDCLEQYHKCRFSPYLMELRQQIQATSDPGLKDILQQMLDLAETGCVKTHKSCLERCSNTRSGKGKVVPITRLPDWLSKQLSLMKLLAGLELSP